MDYEALSALVDAQIAAGVDGLVPVSTSRKQVRAEALGLSWSF